MDLEELSPAADLSQGQADLRHQVQFFLAQAKSFLELAESSPDLAELSLDLAVSLLAFLDLEESSLDLAMSLLAFPDLEESSLDLAVLLLAFPDLEESSLDLEESPLDLVSIDSSRLAPALVSPPALLWVSPPAQWSPLSRSPELSPLDLWLLLAPQFRLDQSAQSPVQQVNNGIQ